MIYKKEDVTLCKFSTHVKEEGNIGVFESQTPRIWDAKNLQYLFVKNDSSFVGIR